MKHVSVLIKPASSLCNMKCEYCFYKDISSLRAIQSYDIMTNTVMLKMIDSIYLDLEDGDNLTIAFQGGEPTIAGIDYFEEFIKYIQSQSKNIDVNYVIQTNGVLIDDRWCKLFKENNFLVGLSIDGPKEIHNALRMSINDLETFNKVMDAKRLFDAYGIEYNILSVLSKILSQKIDEVWDFIINQNIKYIQFIPCLEDFNYSHSHKYALDPSEFSKFYISLYEKWKVQLKKGSYISIKMFDDILNLFIKGQVTACGLTGVCQTQSIIESNGDVYPCDFYVLDEYRLGNIIEHSLPALNTCPKAALFLSNKQDIDDYCMECEYLSICNGGCKRMKRSMYLSSDKISCAYQNLLRKIVPDIPELLEMMKTIREIM